MKLHRINLTGSLDFLTFDLMEANICREKMGYQIVAYTNSGQFLDKNETPNLSFSIQNEHFNTS